MKIPHSSVSSAFFFFLLFLCFSLKAQAQSNKEDIIYHKNGSVIRGHIIENIKDTSKISIETYAKNLWVFDRSEIDSIVTITLPPQKQEEKSHHEQEYVHEKDEPLEGTDEYNKELNQKGYYNITGTSYLIGAGFNLLNSAVRTVNGYRFNKHISAGVVTGFDVLDGAYFPVMLEGRYDILESFTSPFISLQGGYSFPIVLLNDSYETKKGGIILHPNIGIRKNFTKEWGMTLGLGYHFQKSLTNVNEIIYNPDGSTTEYTTKYSTYFNRVSINCRFIFN